MTPAVRTEEAFPKGHPARSDYDPGSPEAIEWARVNVSPLGERDFPVDHPKALDTPGNTNHLTIRAGVDPHNPHMEPFTGRTPAQAAGVAMMSETASRLAEDSPVTEPLDAEIVNAALDDKRRAVGRDVLTPEEYRETIAAIHSAPRDAETEAEIKQRIDRQHRALGALLKRGYTREVALQIIAREGADKIVGED